MKLVTGREFPGLNVLISYMLRLCYYVASRIQNVRSNYEVVG